MSQKPLYTCITCHVGFTDPSLQRSHYKTDWHRYNLKRKVADLPPTTAEAFQERVLALRMEEDMKLEEKQHYCNDCHKNFASEKSLESHLRSNKHLTIIKKNTQTSSPTKTQKETLKQEDEEIEEEDMEDDEPLKVNECLFCPQYFDDLEQNMKHMSITHGFFVPDIEYLTDLNGLMSYLGEKVGVANLCLYCNEKGKMFLSLEAVQHHMIDKSHCKLYFEGDSALEYAEYYDYTKSYPCGHEEEKRDDSVVSPAALKINDDMELVLPSGVTLGHRYLKHHYKQHLPSMEHRRPTVVGKVMANYRAIGWKGSLDVEKKRRNVDWALKMRQQRVMKLGVMANKLQKHLRPQVIF